MSDLRILTGRQTNPLLKPKAALSFGTYQGLPVLFCVLTVGSAITKEIDRAFETGDIERGAELSAKADQALFDFEAELLKRVRKICTDKGLGIRRRLEPGTDLPVDVLSLAFAETDAATALSMRLTSGGMLDPVKSECLVFELSDDPTEFRTAHDCTACGKKDCDLRESIASSAGAREFGIAVDLGSTMVEFAFVALSDGKVLASYEKENSGRKYGADVLTRIRAAMNGKAEAIRTLMQGDLADGISVLTEASGVSHESLKSIVISGNTTMLHLLRGHDVTGLSAAPFAPVTLKAERFDLDGIPTTTLPGISAFVGSDIVSGLYALNLDRASERVLFVDLGTNNEMALLTSGKITVASTAAGSAFARIARKTTGGIGSDIIAETAELLTSGKIDSTGLLLEKDTGFTQQDIRDIQLAKAAVRAGIESLLHQADLTSRDIDRLFLAGTFGERLSLTAAATIGLIPSDLIPRATAVSNTSLAGTTRALTDSDAISRMEHLARNATELSLANDDFFEQEYVNQMDFKAKN